MSNSKPTQRWSAIVDFGDRPMIFSGNVNSRRFRKFAKLDRPQGGAREARAARIHALLGSSLWADETLSDLESRGIVDDALSITATAEALLGDKSRLDPPERILASEADLKRIEQGVSVRRALSGHDPDRYAWIDAIGV